MPAYNAEKYIQEAIESVIRQTHTNWELVIIDDCSMDKTRLIIESFMDNRIKYHLLPKNKGVVYARNFGIDNSNGNYITFLDSDDYWKDNKLEKQLNYLKDYKCHFVYSDYRKINEDGTFRGRIKVKKEVTFSELLKSNIIGCLTVFIDKKVLENLRFRSAICSEDYIMWLDILKTIDKAVGINEELAYYRVLNNSRSSNKVKVVVYQWKIYREVLSMNFISSVYYFINYLFIGFARYVR